MTSGPRPIPEVSLPIATSIGAGGAWTRYLRFLKNCAFTLKTVCNPCLMLVLGAGDAGAGVLVVSVGARDDDMTLLSCLEHVSYAKVFYGNSYYYLFMFNFCFSRRYTCKISDCGEVSGCVASRTGCGAGRGQCPIASRV
jgi:hypothetical protein